MKFLKAVFVTHTFIVGVMRAMMTGGVMTLSVCDESGNPKKISAITQSHIQGKPDSHKNADNQYGFLIKITMLL